MLLCKCLMARVFQHLSVIFLRKETLLQSWWISVLFPMCAALKNSWIRWAQMSLIEHCHYMLHSAHTPYHSSNICCYAKIHPHNEEIPSASCVIFVYRLAEWKYAGLTCNVPRVSCYRWRVNKGKGDVLSHTATGLLTVTNLWWNSRIWSRLLWDRRDKVLVHRLTHYR